MRPTTVFSMKRYRLCFISCSFWCLNETRSQNSWLRSVFTPIYATYSTITQNKPEDVLQKPNNPAEALRRWGCSDDDISIMFSRRPSLRKMDIANLQGKLTLLKSLGIQSTELVRIINCRPRFLNCRINHCFHERLHYFTELFGSREVLTKAIVRNPSLLTYDFHKMIVPTIQLYEDMGVYKNDLISMLLSRPTMIPRTSFDGEKREYITKTAVSKNSKLYKYVVTIIGVSRTETIREKVANLEKFGISEEDVWVLFGRSPLLLTLSVDKVQRNMTFIVGTMKLPAIMVTKHPFLLLANLETVLKPRILLAAKIEDMGLSPQIKGPMIMRALRMKEHRFLKVFVLCHPKDVAKELMELYSEVKGMKRLAEDSKKNWHKGFPF